MCAETPQIASWIAHSIGLCRSIEPLRRHFDGVGPSPRDGVAAVAALKPLRWHFDLICVTRSELLVARSQR